MSSSPYGGDHRLANAGDQKDDPDEAGGAGNRGGPGLGSRLSQIREELSEGLAGDDGVSDEQLDPTQDDQPGLGDRADAVSDEANEGLAGEGGITNRQWDPFQRTDGDPGFDARAEVVGSEIDQIVADVEGVGQDVKEAVDPLNNKGPLSGLRRALFAVAVVVAVGAALYLLRPVLEIVSGVAG